MWFSKLSRLYVCLCFSKPSRLPDCMHPCTDYTGHLHVHNSILIHSPFLRLSLLSLFPFLSLMLYSVLYIHIFSMYIYNGQLTHYKYKAVCRLNFMLPPYHNSKCAVGFSIFLLFGFRVREECCHGIVLVTIETTPTTPCVIGH